ncbi:MAG: hypothetical protein GY700_06375 [Propionibacteriaceae bacterium]|nr:hypothetical protein [Propionibacteriaceae bacterium]
MATWERDDENTGGGQTIYCGMLYDDANLYCGQVIDSDTIYCGMTLDIWDREAETDPTEI